MSNRLLLPFAALVAAALLAGCASSNDASGSPETALKSTSDDSVVTAVSSGALDAAKTAASDAEKAAAAAKDADEEVDDAGKALAKAKSAGKDDSLLGSLFSDSPAAAREKAGKEIGEAAASVAAAKTTAATAAASTDTALKVVSDAGKTLDATDAGFDVSFNDKLEDAKGVVANASKIQTSAGESLLATHERLNESDARTKSLAGELAALNSVKPDVVVPVSVIEPAAKPAKPAVAEASAPVVADDSSELAAEKKKNVVLQAEVGDAIKEKTALTEKIAELETRLAEAKNLAANMPKPVDTSKEVAALKEKVAELETQLEQAKDFAANASKPAVSPVESVAKPATKGVFAKYKALREQLASGEITRDEYTAAVAGLGK